MTECEDEIRSVEGPGAARGRPEGRPPPGPIGLRAEGFHQAIGQALDTPPLDQRA
jgi:hypothetical protein